MLIAYREMRSFQEVGDNGDNYGGLKHCDLALSWLKGTPKNKLSPKWRQASLPAKDVNGLEAHPTSKNGII